MAKRTLALGLAYAYHGRPEQALAEFARAEALAPSDADLLLLIAWSLPQFGEPGRAVSLAETVSEAEPSLSRLVQSRAQSRVLF